MVLVVSDFPELAAESVAAAATITARKPRNGRKYSAAHTDSLALFCATTLCASVLVVSDFPELAAKSDTAVGNTHGTKIKTKSRRNENNKK